MSKFGSLTHGLNMAEPEDWRVFLERLREVVRTGHVKRISPIDPHQFAGLDDEWYLDQETGEIYVYGAPNAPMKPFWEPFNISAPRHAPPPPPGLGAIPMGKKDRLETQGIRGIMEFLIRQGAVADVTPSFATSEPDLKETWFRDLQTGITYRLVEKNGGAEGVWERIPVSELSTKII